MDPKKIRRYPRYRASWAAHQNGSEIGNGKTADWTGQILHTKSTFCISSLRQFMIAQLLIMIVAKINLSLFSAGCILHTNYTQQNKAPHHLSRWDFCLHILSTWHNNKLLRNCFLTKNVSIRRKQSCTAFHTYFWITLDYFFSQPKISVECSVSIWFDWEKGII